MFLICSDFSDFAFIPLPGFLVEIEGFDLFRNVWEATSCILGTILVHIRRQEAETQGKNVLTKTNLTIIKLTSIKV